MFSSWRKNKTAAVTGGTKSYNVTSSKLSEVGKLHVSYIFKF